MSRLYAFLVQSLNNKTKLWFSPELYEITVNDDTLGVLFDNKLTIKVNTGANKNKAMFA
jgi:hypothetical protein